MPDMSGIRRFQFLISQGAKDDLKACKEEDSYAAAKISELLRDVRDDIIAGEALVDERFFDAVVESVRPVWSLQDKRINAYRVRMVVIHAWRIITAVDYPGRRVAVLAVMHRDENYEDNTELWARIEGEYDSFGFPRYGRV